MIAWIAVAALAATQERVKPSFPSQVDVVTVDVVVLDRNGDPVGNLQASDFVVTEDGRPQKLIQFEAVALPESAPAASATMRSRVATNDAAPGPRSFVLVFDNANMTPLNVERVKDAVARFLQTGLRPGDQLTLVPTGGGAWWTARMPEGAADAAAFLKRLKGLRPIDTSSDYISDYEAMRLSLYRDDRIGALVARRFYENGAVPDSMSPRQVAALDIGGGHPLVRAKAAAVWQNALGRLNATLGALERVVESLAAARGRKSVLLISEGFVFDTSVGAFRELARDALRANAVLYFVDARRLTGLSASGSAEQARATMEQDVGEALRNEQLETDGARSIAADSGGFTVKATDLAAGMRRIARESRAYYLLGYQSTNANRDGKFRGIKVELTGGRGLEVRARKGYYAPGGDKPRSEVKGLPPEIRSPLDSPFDDAGIPLRLASYVLRPATAGKVTVLLAAEVDPSGVALRSKGARFEGALETTFLVSARDSGETFHQERRLDLSLPPDVKARLEGTGIPVLRDFELPPGSYQARLLVKDPGSGRIGTVRQQFEVADPNAFHVSTPILTDTLLPAAPGTSAPRPVPIARRRFASDARVFYVYEVFGSRTVSAGYEVRRSDGSVLAKSAATPLQAGPQGEISQMIPISLQGVPAGDYEIVLNVKDDLSGRTVEVRDPFSVP